MTRVHVIALGGTIAMTAGGSGLEPRLDGQDLLARTPGPLAGTVSLTTESRPPVPGAHLTLGDIIDVVRRAHKVLDEGQADGVVVTQGTDTLEETAFAADVLHSGRPEPLVFTGAMRAPDTPGTDGASNLASSIAVAASDEATAQGVLVCMNDELHTARWVRKTHASSTSAFASPGAGIAGHLVEGTPRLRPPPTDRPKGVALERLRNPLAHVLLHRTFLGDDGRMLSSAGPTGYDGTVIEAFGVGHLSVKTAHATTRLAEKMPVVFASRTSGGSTFADTYGFEGSERDLLDRGLIAAGSLEGLKARVLLELVLSTDVDAAAVREMFTHWGQ